MKNRVGLLGGTFNPVHLGHVELGVQIRQAFRLDRIRYILSAKPPHKRNDGIADTRFRWEMLTHALSGQPALEPCDIEINRDGPSYTVDTLTQLSDRFPDEHHYFIIGSDSFMKIETWKTYQALFQMISFIVLLRKASDLEPSIAILDKIGASYLRELEVESLHESDHHRVYFHRYQSERMGLSSTRIRSRLSEGKSVVELLDPSVLSIIERNKLYGCK